VKPTSAASPHRILVVDDDAATAELLRTWLRDHPYDVLEASNGEDGLRVVAAERPDLVLLDLRMPGVDGISVARHIKDDPATRSTPVILLTACRDTETKIEAFAAGADDYVTKPFEFQEMVARIGSMLRRRDLLLGLESKVRDLSATNEQLEALLMIDEKTGLYNFREFRRRLREEWQRAQRYGTPLSLVFLDVDHFKRVNDSLGHPAGDHVLRELATLVAGGARANDVAARYGGEEFAVILPHTDGAMAERVAERIRTAVREFVFLEDQTPTRITVSAGVSTWSSTRAIESVDELIRAADRALYAAKDAGRDRVVCEAEAPRTDAGAPRGTPPGAGCT
jgi:diguanylate cyclase (GGDEF)-like protein